MLLKASQLLQHGGDSAEQSINALEGWSRER